MPLGQFQRWLFLKYFSLVIYSYESMKLLIQPSQKLVPHQFREVLNEGDAWPMLSVKSLREDPSLPCPSFWWLAGNSWYFSAGLCHSHLCLSDHMTHFPLCVCICVRFPSYKDRVTSFLLKYTYKILFPNKVTFASTGI